MQLPSIIGVSGTNGAGKDYLAELLHERAGYQGVSLSDILRDGLTAQGKPHTRENMSGLSKQIREAEGDGGMVRRVFAKYGRDKLCITSLRTPGEAREIQQAGGIVVWVDADPRVRYARIMNGARGRVTDQLSFEEFEAEQRAEMTPSAQGGGLNMAAVRDIADMTIENNFTSLDEYTAHVVALFEL